jgi:hypothetical protein
LIHRHGGNAMAPPYYFGQYLDMPPITEAIGRVKRVLNLSLTPFATGLKDTLKWYQRQPGFKKKVDFSFEDKLIKAAKDLGRPGA